MIDWTNGDWAYLLGVVHGDGNISTRSIRISVGYKDQDYANVLVAIWQSLGYAPKVYRPRSALAIDVHSIALRNEFARYKTKGIWRWPDALDIPEYLAGVFDTDGYSSLAGGKKQIGITLKRSGNLLRLAQFLEGIGVSGVSVKEEISKYNDVPYETESLRITDAARIVQISELITPRNKRKALMLNEVYRVAKEIVERVPIWKQIGLWLRAEGPKDWFQIAEKFELNKAQVDSALQHLKQHVEINVIPPPVALSKYEVVKWNQK